MSVDDHATILCNKHKLVVKNLFLLDKTIFKQPEPTGRELNELNIIAKYIVDINLSGINMNPYITISCKVKVKK